MLHKMTSSRQRLSIDVLCRWHLQALVLVCWHCYGLRARKGDPEPTTDAYSTSSSHRQQAAAAIIHQPAPDHMHVAEGGL